MVADQVRLFEIHMHENLSQFMDGHDKREEKKSETLVLPQDVSISGSALVALANHNMGCRSAFLSDGQAMYRQTSPN